MYSLYGSGEDTHTDSSSESDSELDCSSPPSPSTGAEKKLPTRAQANVLFITIKKHIYRSMFTVDAMPPTEDEQDAVIWHAIESASEETLGYSLEPQLAEKIYKRCKPIMRATWSTFQDSAEMITNAVFELMPPLHVRGSLVSHMRDRLKDIFASDDEFAVLHVRRDDGTGYFEHRCIQSLIFTIAWQDLLCGDVLQPKSMSPLVSLVAACFILALQSRSKSGSLLPKLATHEQLAEVYRRVQGYMNTVVLGNPSARDRFTTFCTSLVDGYNSLYGAREDDH